MAIQKNKILANGSSGNYWKIVREVCDRVALEMVVEIALFLDKAASDAGKQDLGEKKVFRFRVNREQLAGDRTALAYSLIKSKASSMVLAPRGREGDNLVMFDSDLANGLDV